jgi:hypothetical protein
VKLFAKAIEVISKSLAPIGLPRRSKSARSFP